MNACTVVTRRVQWGCIYTSLAWRVMIQQILGSHESTWSFPEFVKVWKISVYSTCLESREKTGHTHFWQCPPKKFLMSLQFFWICMNMQKISLFHLLILQIQSILESSHMTGQTHFWPSQPLKFSITFNLCEFVPACRKSVYSSCSFLRYSKF